MHHNKHKKRTKGSLSSQKNVFKMNKSSQKYFTIYRPLWTPTKQPSALKDLDKEEIKPASRNSIEIN